MSIGLLLGARRARRGPGHRAPKRAVAAAGTADRPDPGGPNRRAAAAGPADVAGPGRPGCSDPAAAAEAARARDRSDPRVPDTARPVGWVPSPDLGPPVSTSGGRSHVRSQPELAHYDLRASAGEHPPANPDREPEEDEEKEAPPACAIVDGVAGQLADGDDRRHDDGCGSGAACGGVGHDVREHELLPAWSLPPPLRRPGGNGRTAGYRQPAFSHPFRFFRVARSRP
jgi:hypothetical protein